VLRQASNAAFFTGGAGAGGGATANQRKNLGKA
jgi:hypothetical protein